MILNGKVANYKFLELIQINNFYFGHFFIRLCLNNRKVINNKVIELIKIYNLYFGHFFHSNLFKQFRIYILMAQVMFFITNKNKMLDLPQTYKWFSGSEGVVVLLGLVVRLKVQILVAPNFYFLLIFSRHAKY